MESVYVVGSCIAPLCDCKTCPHALNRESRSASVRNLYQMIPLGRLGKPEEYASLAVYLASDEHYLVGQIISPNGGAVI